MAKDRFHDAVKLALEQDGWTIETESLHLRWGKVDLYIDLAAERLIVASRDREKIAVEVKSFLSQSTVNDFHGAIGQYLNYRVALAREDQTRILYLAVPEATYEEFFTQPFTQAVVEQYQINFFVYRSDTKEIIQWKTW